MAEKDVRVQRQAKKHPAYTAFNFYTFFLYIYFCLVSSLPYTYFLTGLARSEFGTPR